MIKLKLNSTDELALRHMGNALTNMAVELNGEVPSAKQYGEVVENKSDVTDEPVIVEQELLLRELADNKPVIIEPIKYGKSVVETLIDQVEDINDTINDKLDSNGLPWDGRIHSSSKAKIKDGSWKKRKGVDAEAVATVEAELTALMAIPVESPAIEIEEITQAEIDAGTLDVTPPPPVNHESIVSADPAIGVVVIPKPQDATPEPIVPKPQDATPPPPPVVDAPVGITPDVVEVVSFVEITRFITGTMVKEMGWKIPEVNALLTEQYGVTFSTLKAREDLFDTVFTFLKGQPKK